MTGVLPRAGAVVLTGVLLGAVSSFLQGDGVLGSLANSAGPWALVAFLLALLGTRLPVSMVFGAAALLSLLAGYVLGAQLADHPSGRSLLLFWGLAAVVVGPLLGLGAHWLRTRTPVLAGLGVGGMAGILVGEGVYGLTTVAETTSPTYWTVEIVAGVLLLGWSLARRLASWRDRLVAVLATAAVAALFVVAFRADLIAVL